MGANRGCGGTEMIVHMNFWTWFEKFEITASVISFTVGLPTIIATYYQAYRARQEVRAVRNPPILSENCIEFILSDGSWINLVPLQSLHSVPLPGSIVLLPGDGVSEGAGVYRIDSLEYIYAREEDNPQQPRQAKLTKAVAHVSYVLEPLGEAAE
jgi:hypothetical protein